jgi:hypothetical protein
VIVDPELCAGFLAPSWVDEFSLKRVNAQPRVPRFRHDAYSYEPDDVDREDVDILVKWLLPQPK